MLVALETFQNRKSSLKSHRDQLDGKPISVVDQHTNMGRSTPGEKSGVVEYDVEHLGKNPFERDGDAESLRGWTDDHGVRRHAVAMSNK